ncbi:hypothetical protein [Mycolicibacterium sp. P9-22]|uniref:hypothetical protein n=1 Tax=Mycolicibacterium sp. P9-22 TaxID=2024613 RepID=UPI0011ED6AE4|nr:hypothetical protein [Mycolicibacterium sp. P9-22]
MEKGLYHTTENRYGGGSVFYYACGETGCTGELIRPFGKCIAHLSDNEASDYADQLIRGEGTLVFSGRELDAVYVHRWIERVSHKDDQGKKVIRVPIDLRSARLVGELRLDRTTFPFGINMSGAQLDGLKVSQCEFGAMTSLNLESTTSKNNISFWDSRFNGKLSMTACQTTGLSLHETTISLDLEAAGVEATTNAYFHKIDIKGSAVFRDSRLGRTDSPTVITGDFRSRADFTEAKFPGGAQFGSPGDSSSCNFHGEATFEGTVSGSKSGGSFSLPACSFAAHTSFHQVTVYGSASFDGATFEQTALLDDLTVRKGPRGDAQLSLRGSHFGATPTMRIEVEGVATLEDIQFQNVAEGFTISADKVVQFRRISIESFSAIALAGEGRVVVDQVRMQGGGEIRVASNDLELTNFSSAGPALISDSSNAQAIAQVTHLTTLSGTNCDGVTLSGFDLSRTNFTAASNIDRLVVSGDFALDVTKGWHARRKFLYEEAQFRKTVSSSKQWNISSIGHARSESATEPKLIAATYRSLRKGREDQKDEPGSADFYYGEMEMRRLSSPCLSVERLVLTMYWLVSGYGLRAWRALVSMLAVTVGAAFALSFIPLLREDTCPTSLGNALLFSAQAGLSLAGPASNYSDGAQLVQLVLRITMPVLIALAVLAVRARVKR